MGSPKDSSSQPPRSSSKFLVYGNGSRNGSSNLRTLYRVSAQSISDDHPAELSYRSVATVLPTSLNLPPTPPGANNYNRPAEEAVPQATDPPVFRSSLVTPINQNSPPTPDNTPPRERNEMYVRPFLGAQPSMTSTHAESFKTAQEDITPEEEADGYVQHQENGINWPLSSVDKFGAAAHRLRHSTFLRLPLHDLYGQQLALRQSPESFDGTSPGLKDLGRKVPHADSPLQSLPPSPEGITHETNQVRLNNPVEVVAVNTEALFSGDHPVDQQEIKRGKSLRDRLLEAQNQDPSASTEKFAGIIGWNSTVPVGDEPMYDQRAPIEDSRRLSGISTTSTVEAYVIEQKILPRRQTTLRHVNKHESLRSFSSPLPCSNRYSLASIADSPRRLVHKKARLSNQNRWSFGSEASRSLSLASVAALPKTEVIRVAVIPERSSSLSSSARSSQHQSMSNSSGHAHSRKTSDNPPTSWHHERAFSETVERGRHQSQSPVIPPRNSSLSAPTSRTASRANSVTSEHLQVQRQRAEKDLRKTLDRMESERLLNSLRDTGSVEPESQVGGCVESRQHRISTPPTTPRTPTGQGTEVTVPNLHSEMYSKALGLVEPGTTEWAALRPPSVFNTPFSQPSFQSMSPEITEAKAINYFPHNNHSLQLIEPYPVPESRAVRAVQRQRQKLPEIEVESPLRNPRMPPEPPLFTVIPPTPDEDINRQLRMDRMSSLKRPSGIQQRSESLMNSVSNKLSLKNTRNRKTDQDLDNSLHPMWRPRAFWDDIDSVRPEGPDQKCSPDQGAVNNSLGLPQARTVIMGPVSLVRRISERRKKKRQVVRHPSHSSLTRLRASRKVYRSGGFGLRFDFAIFGGKGFQQRVLQAKQRKENERRERRRAKLRRSIGAIVISKSDSRFPASNTSLSRDV